MAAHLVERVAGSAGLGAAWRTRAYAAYWADGVDLGDVAKLIELAGEVGLETEGLAALLSDRAHASEVRRQMLTYRGKGVGGVPVLDLNGALAPASVSDDELRQLASLG